MANKREEPAAAQTIEELLTELLHHYRLQGQGLLGARVETPEALDDFACAAAQIHAAIVSPRLVHAATAAATCLGAAQQIISRLEPRFSQAQIHAALAGPPGPQLRAEIAQLAEALFDRAAQAAAQLDSARWQSCLDRHRGALLEAIIDYCQRTAEQAASGLHLPSSLSREIHLSMRRLTLLQPVVASHS